MKTGIADKAETKPLNRNHYINDKINDIRYKIHESIRLIRIN